MSSLLKAFNETISELKEFCLGSSKPTNWALLETFLKKRALRLGDKFDKLPSFSEEAQLLLVARAIIPQLFDQGLELSGITEEGLAKDAKNLIENTTRIYKTDFPEAIEKWWQENSDKSHSTDGPTIQAVLLDLDLELPFVNRLTASVRSAGWCDVCKKLRNTLKPVIALSQGIVYRSLALATHDVCALDPLWDVVLDRKDEEGVDEVDQEEVDSSSESEENASESADSASASDSPASVVTAPSSGADDAMQDDEIIEVSNVADFERYLDVLKDEVQLIAAKRDTVRALKKLPPQTEEELDICYGRRTRAAKMIHLVLTRVKVEAWKEADLDALMTLFENVAAPTYGLFAQLGKYLGSIKTRDLAWVKRLKELLSDGNKLSKTLVNLISEKLAASRKDTGSSQKKPRLATTRPNHLKKAVLSYAMCYQNALLFYLARARTLSDDGWQQLVSTLQWTSQLCDRLWTQRIDIKEAAAYLEPETDDDDTLEQAIWSVTVGDSINVHPPQISCDRCRGKKQPTSLQCLNTKSHLEMLLLKIVVDGHQYKKNTPARLFKAFQEAELTIPTVVFVHSLFKLSNSKSLARELIGLMIKN